LESELLDGARGAPVEGRPFAGRRIAVTAERIVVDRLEVVPAASASAAPKLGLDAQVSHSESADAVSGPYRLRTFDRRNAKHWATVLQAMAAVLTLGLALLKAHSDLQPKQTAVESGSAVATAAPSPRRSAPAWLPIGLVLGIVGLSVLLTWLALRW
jgi:hypothetical protein